MSQAQKMPLDQLVMHKRQRQEYDPEKLGELADSIRRTRGLLHPIVVDPADGSLVAGGRRTMAYLLLMANHPEEGWDHIPFVFKDQENELFRKSCELEENLQRVDLQWWEAAQAVAAIHELQKEMAAEKGETWNMRMTAELVGKSLGTVQQSVELVEVAKTKPEIKKEQTLSGALTKVKTEKQIEKRKEDIRQKESGKIRTYPAEILVGDAKDLIKLEKDNEFDAIATNFPFGVEYGYSGKADKVYEDEEDQIIDLVREVVREGYRVLKDDSWFIAFFDVRKITYSNPQREFAKEVLNYFAGINNDRADKIKNLASKSLGLAYWFEEAGFSYVSLVPIIWAKPNKTQGNIGDPRKGLVVAYEAAVIAAKGDAVLLKQGKQDLLVFDTLLASERDFAMQMPKELCKELLSWTVLGGARILDPFAGVGSFGEGALDLQCSFRGFELNQERAEVGNLRLREHTFAKAATNENA